MELEQYRPWRTSRGANGTLTQHNAFFNTGGSIVDVTLNVVAVPNGISKVREQSTKTEHIYDVTGRRLQTAPSKGVYIRNGKVFVK